MKHLLWPIWLWKPKKASSRSRKETWPNKRVFDYEGEVWAVMEVKILNETPKENTIILLRFKLVLHCVTYTNVNSSSAMSSRVCRRDFQVLLTELIFYGEKQKKIHDKLLKSWNTRLNNQKWGAWFPESRFFRVTKERHPNYELSWSTGAARRTVSSDCWRIAYLGHWPGWLHVKVIALPRYPPRTTSQWPKSIRSDHITPQKANTLSIFHWAIELLISLLRM